MSAAAAGAAPTFEVRNCAVWKRGADTLRLFASCADQDDAERVGRALVLLAAVEVLDDAARVAGVTISRTPRGSTVLYFQAGSHRYSRAAAPTIDGAVTRAAGELVRR